MAPDDRKRVQHCWLQTTEEPATPALVVEWACNRNTWYARVVYLRNRQVRDGWFPDTRLTPILR